MQSTIKDVAQKAGVSIATVSLVINKNPRISDITARKVQKAIKSLNYFPSRSARDLVSKKTGNIGFILTDDHFLRTEPFYTKIFLGTEFEAREGEYYILLTTVKSDLQEKDKLPRFIVERNVDGIIVAGKVPKLLIDKLCGLKIPIVYVDYHSPADNCQSVLLDNVQGGILAVEHLLQLGHKNIGFIGADIEHPSISDRLNGYKIALAKNDVNINPDLIVTSDIYPDRQSGYNSAKKLFSKNKNITALFACNDAMALGAMHYLKENKYKIPEDVSIVGFDDVEADQLLETPLTTIRAPKLELGARALKLVTEGIKQKNKNPQKILVPVELIVRKSTTKNN